MKKKVLILGMCSLFLCGCGKIPTLSNGDEAVVTFNDGSMISANDFYEEIKNTYGLNTLVNMIDKYIYETEFKDNLSDAKTYASSYIDQLVSYYGSEDDLLSTIQSYYGFQSIDAFEESIYLNYLQDLGAKTYVKDNISEEELQEYYENSVYPDMTISHILVTADVTDDMSDEEKEAAEAEAKTTIENIIKELDTAKKNNEDIADTFASLAKKYSEDESTKDDGGNLGEININSLDSQYDELVKAAAKLNDGEYSTEVITTELGYHVILKTATGEKASYDDSLDSMKDAITTDKLSADSSLSVEAIKYYRDKYDMDIIDSEVKSQYSTYMNNLINSTKTNS